MFSSHPILAIAIYFSPLPQPCMQFNLKLLLWPWALFFTQYWPWPCISAHCHSQACNSTSSCCCDLELYFSPYIDLDLVFQPIATAKHAIQPQVAAVTLSFISHPILTLSFSPLRQPSMWHNLKVLLWPWALFLTLYWPWPCVSAHCRGQACDSTSSCCCGSSWSAACVCP